MSTLWEQVNAACTRLGIPYQKFTPDEQECIARKVKIHKDEGMEQDQAVRVAIKKCAPAKSKPESSQAVRDPDAVCGDIWFNGTDEQRGGFKGGTAGRGRDEKPPKAWWDDCISKVGKSSSSMAYQNNPEIPGGKYRADQNPDGTWNVRRVPVYPVHKRNIPAGYDNEKGGVVYDTFKVNKKWLDKTLAHHQYKRQREGFLYPLHVNHHAYCGGSPGELVKGVGFIMPVGVGPHLLDGEVVDTLFMDFIAVKPEMFALIEKNELPYCSAEILDLSTNTIHSVSLMEHHVPYFRFPLITIGEKSSYPAPAKAAAACAGSWVNRLPAAVAYSKGGSFMPEEEKKTVPPEEKDVKKKEASQEMTPPAGPPAEEVPAWAQKIIMLLEQLLGGKEEELPPGGGPGPAVAASEGFAKQLGELEAKVDVATKTAEDLKAEKVLDAKIVGWVSEVAPYNLGSDADVEAKLRKMVEEGGESKALGYVNSVKENMQPMPPPPGTPASELPSGTYPEPVMAYAKHGPSTLILAQKAWDQYEEAKAHGIHSGLSQEDFLKFQMVEITGERS